MLHLVVQSCLTLYDPMDHSLPGSSVLGAYPGKNTGVSCHGLLQGIFPTQGSNPGLLRCRLNSLLSELPGKPKNIGVSSLSLLQGIFPTQKSNQSLLHCRRILYQLSYPGRSNIFLKKETSPFNPAACSQQIQSNNPVIKICSLPLFKLW